MLVGKRLLAGGDEKPETEAVGGEGKLPAVLDCCASELASGRKVAGVTNAALGFTSRVSRMEAGRKREEGSSEAVNRRLLVPHVRGRASPERSWPELEDGSGALGLLCLGVYREKKNDGAG